MVGSDATVLLFPADLWPRRARTICPWDRSLRGLRSIKTVEEEKRSNAWWLSTVLPYSGWQPFRIAWATDAEQQIQAVQAADVNALAQTYLKDSRVFAVVGVSAKTLDQASRSRRALCA